MARTPEGKVKDKCTAVLRELGAYYFFPATGGYGKSGVPDIVVCLNGHFVGIECKADIKKSGPTALQKQQLLGIHKAGGLSMVIDARNVHKLHDRLSELL